MTNISNQLKCSIFTVQLKTLFAKQEVQYGWKSEGQSERIRTFKSTIREWDRPKVDSCCPVCHSLPQRILEKKTLRKQIWDEEGADMLLPLLHYPLYSLLLLFPSHSGFFFYLHVFSDQISNFGLSAIHPSIYLRIVPFISSMDATVIC